MPPWVPPPTEPAGNRFWKKAKENPLVPLGMKLRLNVLLEFLRLFMHYIILQFLYTLFRKVMLLDGRIITILIMLIKFKLLIKLKCLSASFDTYNKLLIINPLHNQSKVAPSKMCITMYKRSLCHTIVAELLGYHYFAGCFATVGALSFGLVSFKRGNMVMSQNMMRLRVIAQGGTILALICGIVLASTSNN